jgi:hypothetical protein
VENIIGQNNHVKIRQMCSEKIREKIFFTPHHGSILPHPRVPPFVRMVLGPLSGSGLGGRGTGRKSGNREEDKERENRDDRTFRVRHSRSRRLWRREFTLFSA